MKKINYNNSIDLAKRVIKYHSLLSKKYSSIGVFGHYDVIKEVLEALIREGVFIGGGIELEDYDISNYDMEFALFLDEYGVTVEKKWHDENEYHGARYFDSECDAAFIHEDCNSKILKHIKADLVIEFSLYSDCCESCRECDEEDDGDDDDCCGDKDEDNMDTHNSESTHVSRGMDGRVLGFTKHWSTQDDGIYKYSSYSHYSDDIGDIKRLAKEFGVEL